MARPRIRSRAPRRSRTLTARRRPSPPTRCGSRSATSSRKLLNQNENLSSSLNNVAQNATDTIGATLANPIRRNQLSQLQLSAGQTPTLQNSYASGQLQTGYDTGPALQYGYDAGGNIQKDVNLDANAPTTFANTKNQVQYFQPGDFSAARDSATQAVLQRLAPTMAAQQESLNSNLANQGTAQGSAAYKRRPASAEPSQQ